MIGEPGRDEMLLVGGLVLGLAVGVLIQARHFCIMGALADLVLFGSARRLRVWLLAIATAIAGTQLLAGSGLLPLAESGHLSPTLPLGPLVLGGLAFGFGMVLAGGCASRNLVRAAAGSLDALVVLLVMAVSAWAALVGLLAPAHRALREATSFTLGSSPEAQAIWRALAVAGADTGLARLATVLLVAGALLAFVLIDPRVRRSLADLATGLGLGLAVVAGWLLTGVLATDPFEPAVPTSLSYVGPVAQTLRLVIDGGGPGVLGPALVVGTFVGALLAAPAAGGFRLRGPASAAELGRHLVGGALMGVGGALAMGCTVGQGLSGLSTLSLGSLIATAAIVAGGVWALRWLEPGRLVPVPAGRPRSLGAAAAASGVILGRRPLAGDGARRYLRRR